MKNKPLYAWAVRSSSPHYNGLVYNYNGLAVYETKKEALRFARDCNKKNAIYSVVKLVEVTNA